VVPQKRELDRHVPYSRRALKKSVDALGVGQDHPAHLAVGILPIGLAQPVKAEGTDGAVGVQRHFAKKLTQPAAGGAPVKLHLPQPLLGVDESLRKKKIVDIRSIDMRDTPPVADHLDGR
jgi:hypothetical protein